MQGVVGAAAGGGDIGGEAVKILGGKPQLLAFSVYSNFCHYILLRLSILLALWTMGPALCMRSCFDWVLR